jgi:uncharacterized phage-associated protein
MPASTFSAARTLCSFSDWKLSNLPLQKLLYLSHMYHLGRYGTPLIDGHFEAWDLGPVEPDLYRKVRAYGDRAIVDIFNAPLYKPSSTRFSAMKEVYDDLGTARPGQLVNITHQQGYAWANCYRPNVKGIVIRESEILNEYRRRLRRSEREADH